MAAATASAVTTPRAPSKRPPSGGVSRWSRSTPPPPTGRRRAPGRAGCRRRRRWTARPASRIQPATSSWARCSPSPRPGRFVPASRPISKSVSSRSMIRAARSSVPSRSSADTRVSQAPQGLEPLAARRGPLPVETVALDVGEGHSPDRAVPARGRPDLHRAVGAHAARQLEGVAMVVGPRLRPAPVGGVPDRDADAAQIGVVRSRRSSRAPPCRRGSSAPSSWRGHRPDSHSHSPIQKSKSPSRSAGGRRPASGLEPAGRKLYYVRNPTRFAAGRYGDPRDDETPFVPATSTRRSALDTAFRARAARPRAQRARLRGVDVVHRAHPRDARIRRTALAARDDARGEPRRPERHQRDFAGRSGFTYTVLARPTAT